MAESEPSPEEAADRVIAPDHLMSGEYPGTVHVEDAVHWMQVYSELLEFKDDLIDTALRHMAEMTAEGSSEVRNSDLVLLKAERERFQGRLDFWKARYQELADGSGDLTTHP